MPKAILVAMRTANLSVTHPQAKYGYKCATCGEDMCLFPSGQRLLREHAVDGVELRCEICVEQHHKDITEMVIPREVARERRETIDFTKRKQ